MLPSLGECQVGTPRALVVAGQGRSPRPLLQAPRGFLRAGGADVFQSPGPRTLLRNVLKELLEAGRYAGATTKTLTGENWSLCVCVCMCVCKAGPDELGVRFC